MYKYEVEMKKGYGKIISTVNFHFILDILYFLLIRYII